MNCPNVKELYFIPLKKTSWPWTEGTLILPDKMQNGCNWPKISIVTPSYNQGRLIEETIRSVLLQCYTNLGRIIMDNNIIAQVT